eukprot:scaffold2141_cov120-Cylindrotheca_fusiformis.AAC.2
MPLVSLTRGLSSQGVVERLVKEKREPKATGFAFFEISFTDDITLAFLDLLRFLHQHQRRRLGELIFFSCPGGANLSAILQASLALDLFSVIRIQGAKRDPNYSQPALTVESLGGQIKHARNLTTLNLSFLRISSDTTEFLKMMLENNVHLERLMLSNIVFEENATGALCSGLTSNPKLKVIALVSCGLSDIDLALLLDSLLSHPALTTLRLFGNQCRSCSLLAMRRLLNSPRCKLQSLDMHHQFSPSERRTEDSESTLDLRLLAEQWQGTYRNRTLRRLVLSGDRLEDKDMKYMGMLLRRLPNLEELDLDGNHLTDCGLRELANHSQVPSRLRTLRLAENSFSHDAAPALLELLRQHPELQCVTPSTYWKVSTPHGNEIRNYLEQNRAGRVLLCRKPTIPLSVWPTVLSKLTRHSIGWGHYDGLYYLLRNGPVILEPGKSHARVLESKSNDKKRRRDAADRTTPTGETPISESRKCVKQSSTL